MKNMGGSRKTSPLYKTYIVNTLATTIKIFFNTLSRFFSFNIHFVFVTAYLTQKPEKPPKALCLIDQQAKNKTHSSHSDVLLHVKAVIISRLNLVTKLSSFRKFV